MKITMGNDEFILYIRKRYRDCSLNNATLGRRIWEGLRAIDPGARKVEEMALGLRVAEGSFLKGKLPKTATQFEFDREVLPQLYSYLDRLGREAEGE